MKAPGYNFFWVLGVTAIIFQGEENVLSKLPGINGQISFAGVLAANSTSVGTATAITGFGSANSINATGNYVTIPNFTPVSWSPFSLGQTSIIPLWACTNNGISYRFSATSLTVNRFNAGGSSSLFISGQGIAQITGFADTPGTWSFAVQDPPANSDNEFTFSASFKMVATNTLPRPGQFILRTNLLFGTAHQMQSPTNFPYSNWNRPGILFHQTNAATFSPR
jgi:hypothetical protein